MLWTGFITECAVVGEMWKDVPGWEGKYAVSNLGRVRSLPRVIMQKAKSGAEYAYRKRGQILRPGRCPTGYYSVSLGRYNSILVHVLVAAAFIGPCPKKHEVRHLDGTRDNNRADNLAYGTRRENNLDVNLHDRRKYSTALITSIRNAPSGPTLREFSEMFGVSASHIDNIRKRRQRENG